MRALKSQIVVQLLLGYAGLGFLHGLRRVLSYYYHQAVASLGWALPLPTEAFGLPVLGGGFHNPQPHTLLFYLFWGAVALAPLGIAWFAWKGADAEEASRRWHGWMAVYGLAFLVALLAVALCLAMPLIPIGSAVG